MLVALFQNFSCCLLSSYFEPILESIDRSLRENCKLWCCLLILYSPFWSHFPVIPLLSSNQGSQNSSNDWILAWWFSIIQHWRYLAKSWSLYPRFHFYRLSLICSNFLVFELRSRYCLILVQVHLVVVTQAASWFEMVWVIERSEMKKLQCVRSLFESSCDYQE